MSESPIGSTTESSAEPTRWQSALTAVQFLTRVPVPAWLGPSPMGQPAAHYQAALRGAVLFFPLVGGLVGLFTGAVAAVLAEGFPPLVSVAIALGLEALLTGAFHEDALADTCDALGGGWDREQVLTIMKDSRLGTYGTIGLVIGLAVRAAAIASLVAAGPLVTVAACAAAGSLGRLAIVGMMATTEPVTDRQSAARDVAGTQTLGTVGRAALLSAPLWLGWAVLDPLRLIGGLVAAVAVLLWFRGKIQRRIGGTTGDLLGCSAYLAQLAILVAASFGAGHAD